MLANWPPVDPTHVMTGVSHFQEMFDELYENGLLPPADIYVSDRFVTVEVAVSGARPESFQIAVTPNSVTITGEVQRELDLGEIQYRGIRRGDFHTALNLPVPIDPTDAEASYVDGMLKLRMVKAEVTQPRLVPVRHESGNADGKLESVQRERVPVGRT